MSNKICKSNLDNEGHDGAHEDQEIAVEKIKELRNAKRIFSKILVNFIKKSCLVVPLWVEELFDHLRHRPLEEGVQDLDHEHQGTAENDQ